MAEDSSFGHAPVMLTEIGEVFAPIVAGTLVDATLGGGGHASSLLAAHPALHLVGLDQDDAAIAAATEQLAPFADRVRIVRTRFDRLSATLSDLGIDKVAGVLFDLGVSSAQLDRADRGFSYRADGPLDMRMDRRAERTAADLVNGLEAGELADVLRRFGDERLRRPHRALVAARPVTSTRSAGRHRPRRHPCRRSPPGGDPAKRSRSGRCASPSTTSWSCWAMRSGDRCPRARRAPGVLAYHSGEDRIVRPACEPAEAAAARVRPSCRASAAPNRS
ncbi:MAG: 16S rRNA (cytosine(1402)-N(4))-methyltransferase [Acidimicrobiales bacterium]